MALTEEQTAAVAAILEAHPDWPSTQVRAEAGLAPTAFFSVRQVRVRLGYPEPGAEPGKMLKRKAKMAPTAEILEDDDGEEAPARAAPRTKAPPKRAGGPAHYRPQSILAPILPRLAEAMMHGIMRATNNVSRGRAPMTGEEAGAIAVRTVRIADRLLGKYIKVSTKITPNGEDTAMIIATFGGWVIGWGIAGMTRGQRPQPQAAGHPEPAASAISMGPVYTRPATSGPAVVSGDDGDLFAGSEPLAASAVAVGANARMNGSGPLDAAPMTDAAWAAISPTDYGEAPE